MRLVCITNTYNEYFNLPIWFRYYSRQVGSENCIIFDHGSDKEALAGLDGATIIRLPRSTFDDMRRSRSISNLVNSLLGYVDVACYTDSDEILVPDPRKYADLLDFASKMERPAVTAIGMNILHEIYEEDALRSELPILRQRKYCQYVSAMCKTLITKRDIRWGGGFHSSSEEIFFQDLYLFHLRSVDLGESLKRLALTRKLDWADANAGLHQRRENRVLLEFYQHYAAWPKSERFELGEGFQQTVLSRSSYNEHDKLYYVPHDANIHELIRIPEWLTNAF